MSVAWLIAFVVFLVVEGMTASLTSIWFAGGALAALVVQVCGAPLRPQLAVFVIVSFVLFMMDSPRPSVHRYKASSLPQVQARESPGKTHTIVTLRSYL